MSEEEKAKMLKDCQDTYDKEIAKGQKIYNDHIATLPKKEDGLKKRIQTKARTVYDIVSSYADDWCIYSENKAKNTLFVEVKDVFTILEEAKKAFLKEGPLWGYPKDFSKKELEMIKNIVDQVTARYEDWYKKWFGDVK
jgi:hypothetical protein